MLRTTGNFYLKRFSKCKNGFGRLPWFLFVLWESFRRQVLQTLQTLWLGGNAECPVCFPASGGSRCGSGRRYNTCVRNSMNLLTNNVWFLMLKSIRQIHNFGTPYVQSNYNDHTPDPKRLLKSEWSLLKKILKLDWQKRERCGQMFAFER